MALSDACAQFLWDVSEAAAKLAADAHHYSAPDYPLDYGPEIDALRRLATTVSTDHDNVEAGAQLLKLAVSVRKYHDTPPPAAELAGRKAEMMQLVRLMQRELTGEDAAAVSKVVENIASETPDKEGTARMRTMLSKLGKSSYEMAVKIISDVGSATAKKMLGI